MSTLLGFSALLMLALLLVPRSGSTTSLTAGESAPAFSLPSPDGQQVALDDLAGKPLILNFWASWCAPCRREMPEFQAVYEKYKEQGLQFYAINIGESRVAVSNFLDQVGVDLPVLLDLEEKAQEDYRILPLPATFFIDRSGKITAVYQYQMNKAQMEAEVLRLLAE